MDPSIELKGHIGHLDEIQQKAFQEFKAKVEAEIQMERKWYDDATLLRFLRARNFDLTAAFKQFSTTCQWRREKDLDSLYENFDVEALEDSKRLLPNWTGKTDKMGRGVFVYKIATLGGKETSELLKTKVEDRYDGVVCLTELLQRFTFPFLSSLPSKSTPTPISSCTTITDLEHITLRALWGLRTHVQSASLISSSHYPETSSRIIIVNAPSFMPILFGWISKLLEPVTVSKILIMGSDPSRELLGIIDEDSLPICYGGKLDWVYGDKPAIGDEMKEALGEQGVPKGPISWEDGKVKVWGKGR